MIEKDDHILITGGSGFIGTNLINFLEERDHNIINFDKNPPIRKEHEKYWIKGNIMNIDDLKSVFNKFNPTIIIHLAARTDTLSDKLEDYDENVTGTENLINEVKKHSNIKHLVVTSTQYVYKNKDNPFGENDSSYSPHTVYGESKRLTEEITRNSEIQCKWTIIRPCNVWGPWHMRYPEELWKVIAKGYYIHPSKKPVIRTYSYVKNLVYQLYGILIDKEERVNKKTYYLGDLPVDSYIWLNAFSKEINGNNIKRIPRPFFYIAAIFGDILKKFGIKFPLYSMRYKNMIEDYYAPSNITVYLFGSYNNSYKNNVKETIDWLKTDGINYFKYWKNRYY